MGRFYILVIHYIAEARIINFTERIVINLACHFIFNSKMKLTFWANFGAFDITIPQENVSLILRQEVSSYFAMGWIKR